MPGQRHLDARSEPTGSKTADSEAPDEMPTGGSPDSAPAAPGAGGRQVASGGGHPQQPRGGGSGRRSTNDPASALRGPGGGTPPQPRGLNTPAARPGNTTYRQPPIHPRGGRQNPQRQQQFQYRQSQQPQHQNPTPNPERATPVTVITVAELEERISQIMQQLRSGQGSAEARQSLQREFTEAILAGWRGPHWEPSWEPSWEEMTKGRQCPVPGLVRRQETE